MPPEEGGEDLLRSPAASDDFTAITVNHSRVHTLQILYTTRAVEYAVNTLILYRSQEAEEADRFRPRTCAGGGLQILAVGGMKSSFLSKLSSLSESLEE